MLGELIEQSLNKGGSMVVIQSNSEYEKRYKRSRTFMLGVRDYKRVMDELSKRGVWHVCFSMVSGKVGMEVELSRDECKGLLSCLYR